MPVEIDRAALVEQIEVAFADGRSTRERVKFLNHLPLASAQTLPYEAQALEALFRNRVWQTVAFEAREQLHESDCAAELSDEALAYYLPALLIMAVSDPSWLVNQENLERRLIASFGSVTQRQQTVVLDFIEWMVAFYSFLISEQDALDADAPLLDVEEVEYRLLMYLDEKRALAARWAHA